MHNSLGMPCAGYEEEEKVLPDKLEIAHAKGKKLIWNFAPVTDCPAEESLEGIQRAFAAGVDGVILNAGCPNVKDTDGTQHAILSRNPQAFGKVLSFLREANLPEPIWVRLSPQESFSNMSVIGNHIKNSGIVSAVLVPNTWSVDMPIKDNGESLLDTNTEKVGKSGPAMATGARKETAWAVSALKGSNVDVISSSSIMDEKELKHRLGQGAVAGAGTTFFYASENGWSQDVDRLLWDFAT
ncbi:MAG: hypothetical protein U5L95_03305 [Candidatus Saccharibacteria bacterium]|nr:hypothetical protein [Candidatus Saccharibacteria bacterium]